MPPEDALADQRPGRAAVDALQNPLPRLRVRQIVLARTGVDPLTAVINRDGTDGQRRLGIGQGRLGAEAALPYASTGGSKEDRLRRGSRDDRHAGDPPGHPSECRDRLRRVAGAAHFRSVEGHRTEFRPAASGPWVCLRELLWHLGRRPSQAQRPVLLRQFLGPVLAWPLGPRARGVWARLIAQLARIGVTGRPRGGRGYPHQRDAGDNHDERYSQSPGGADAAPFSGSVAPAAQGTGDTTIVGAPGGVKTGCLV